MSEAHGPIDELGEISGELLKVKLEWITAMSGSEQDRLDVERRRGFLLGRAFEITSGLEEHPEFWGHTSNCDQCGDRA